MGTLLLIDCVIFFNDTATTEIYTLSLHDALPICDLVHVEGRGIGGEHGAGLGDTVQRAEDLLLEIHALEQDRKSTRLNSSHANISYAVFCLKKKTRS